MNFKKSKSVRMERKVVKKEPAAAAVPSPSEKEKPKKIFQLVRGMHDVLPKEEKYWRIFYEAAQRLADYFQYGRIETPVLEEMSLFVRSVGRGTDIVDKEMYVFEDRDGTKLALRPEGTVPKARAYIGHGMWNYLQPVKLWYWEPMFRHDRPQAGRYRQHYQAGFETLGAKDPAIDAELILVAYNFYKDAGLPVEIRINCIGTMAERERYVTELTNYYRTKRGYLCEDCRMRLTKNPLRLLDCKEPQCQPVREEAPHIVDWLGDESKNFFMKTLEYLDELSVPYTLSPYLVRGLDYYTGFVFEVYPVFPEAPAPAPVVAEAPLEADIKTDQPTEPVQPEPSAQSALGGGGRYDVLVEDLGGRPTPAAGFGLGIERAVLALKHFRELNPEPIIAPTYDAFFAQLGEEAKRSGLNIMNQLRSSGIKLAFNFAKNSLKNQLEAANGLKVPYVLILGQKEVQDQTVIIRDMESGVQEVVGQKKLEAALKKKLQRVDAKA